MLRKILAVAWLEILGGIRRYAIIGLIFLAFALEMAGLLFVDFIPRDIGRASIDFILTVGWLAGMLFLLFHCVQSFAWSDDRRTLHTLLARPLTRQQYVFGCYLGLATLLIVLNTVLAALGFGVLHMIRSSLSMEYFQGLSLSRYVLAWAGLFCIELVLLAVIALFSSLVRGGFPVLILTVSYYFICVGLPVVRNAMMHVGSDGIISLNNLLTGLAVLFPDFNRFDFKSIIIHSEYAVSLSKLFASCGLLIFFLFIVLSATCFIYQKRDLR